MEVIAAVLTAAEDRLTWASGLGSTEVMDHTSLYRHLAESSTVAILLRTMTNVSAQNQLIAFACSFFAIISAVMACFHLKTIKQFIELSAKRNSAMVGRLAEWLPTVPGMSQCISIPGLQKRLSEQVVCVDELRELRTKTSAVVTDAELARDGWELMMDKETDSMVYRAWRRDLQDGLTEYRSSTLVKGVRPHEMNELYLDDENRLNWDFCFRDYNVLSESSSSSGGGDIVRWVRKFPVCSFRDYVLARRCFVVEKDDEGSVYTITRSTEHPDAPRQEKPHRVDRFYSSWLCRNARWPGSREPATETVLIHCEDIGIPRDIAKFVVKQGMWRMVLKIEEAVRAYVTERAARGGLPRPGLTGVCARPTRVTHRELSRGGPAEASGRAGAGVGGEAFMKKYSQAEADDVARRRRIKCCVALGLGIAALAMKTNVIVPSAGLLAVKLRNKLARRR